MVKPRPPVLSMIRMQGSSDKVNPAQTDKETAVGHETDVVTEMLVKLALDEHRACPVSQKRGLLISLNLKEIKYSFKG